MRRSDCSFRTEVPPGPGKGDSSARGQSLVELAFVAPILLLLLGAILQFGFIFVSQVGVINATREAARNAAATTPTLDQATASANGDFVYQQLVTKWLPKNVVPYDSSAVDTSTGTTQICYSKYKDASNAIAIQVTVTTVYRHPLFIPLVANVIDAIDGSSDGRFRLSSSETMRVGNPEQLPGYTGDIPPKPPQVCYQ